MAQLTEVVLTDELAGLLVAATETTLRADEDGVLVSLDDNEKKAIRMLGQLFAQVQAEPERFPVTPGMHVPPTKFSTPKGPAQPPRKRRRVTRHKRRIEAAKARRAARKETTHRHPEPDPAGQDDTWDSK